MVTGPTAQSTKNCLQEFGFESARVHSVGAMVNALPWPAFLLSRDYVFLRGSAEREDSPKASGEVVMQGTSVTDQQDRDTASLVPEWPSAIEGESRGVENDHLASGGPSMMRRMLRSLGRFSVAVLIGVGATLAWQSYGDEAREMLSAQIPSLSWLFVSTTTLAPSGRGSTQNTAVPQSMPVPQAAAPAVAATTPELAQLEPMAGDLASMRRSLERLAVKQEQMAQNMATLQAAAQDIRQKISSRLLSPTNSDQPHKPPKPPVRSSPAQSPPVPPPPAVAQSPSQSRSGSP